MNSQIVKTHIKYNNLPEEIHLHILKFANLETLIDVIRYVNKQHQKYVIDILKQYTLQKSDYNNVWFEYIQSHRTFFLHKHINILWDDTPIRLINKQTKLFNWNLFIERSIHYSILHNDIEFYSLLINTYFLNIEIKTFMDKRNIIKSWYFTLLYIFTNNISLAISFNSLNIIKFILTDKYINFISLIDIIKNYNNEDLNNEEYNTKENIFLEFAQNTVQNNKIHILNYFKLFYNYTNKDYNNLLINCSTSKILNDDIKNNEPNIIDYISLNITELFTQTLTSFIENVSIYDNTMLHFITSYQSKLSLQHYQYVLDYYIRQPNFNYPNNTNNNQTYFLIILRLYINHYNILENQHSSFEPGNYFINYKYITKNLENIKECIKYYPKEDIHIMFTHSFLYKLFIKTIETNNTEVMETIKNIFLNEYIKYGFTKEDFSNIIVYFINIYIKDVQRHKHNIIKYKDVTEFLDKLISGIPNIYTESNIQSFILSTSIYCYNSNILKYFNTLCVNKVLLLKSNYIILLNNSLSLLFSDNTYSNSSTYEYLLLLLKTIDKPFNFNTNTYKKLLYRFITNIFCENDEDINLQKIKIMFEYGLILCKSKDKYIFNILKKNEKCYKIKEVINLINKQMRKNV
jgi:hypothetical protein